MPSLTRFLALSLLLLSVLIVAAVTAQVWLRHQEERLRRTTEARLEAQLQAAVEVTETRYADWPEARAREIGRLLATEVRVLPRFAPGAWAVAEGVWLAVEPPTPAAARWLLLFQRVLIALGLLAGLLFVALAAALSLRRPGGAAGTPPPFAPDQRDALSLAQLARTSVAQQAELDRERDERSRAEGEARARLQLLNRALEEKIRIGRDLHDGVIQSLYAAGLTLQSAEPLVGREPAQARERIDTTVQLINRTIAEIRAYISGLSPLSVRGNSIARALEDVVEDLRAGRDTVVERDIDERAASQLNDQQMIDTLQITREAVSNALRHGGARRLTLSLRALAGEVEVVIQDDGSGFSTTSAARGGGHGLGNMRARAERAGGRLDVTSAPGAGCTVSLRWPVSIIP